MHTAHASSEMVQTTQMKPQFLQDTVAQKPFGINIDAILDPMTCEYFSLMQDKELAKWTKLKKRWTKPDLGTRHHI